MSGSLLEMANALREAIMIFPNTRPAKLENIVSGVKLAGLEVSRYKQYDNGYWNITFSNEKYGNLDILSREPEDIAKEIKAYIYFGAYISFRK